MYNFALNHDHKIWSIIVIKDVLNHNQQHYGTCTLNDLIHVHLKDKQMWTFLWNMLKPIINLKTCGEGLNNEKHIQY